MTPIHVYSELPLLVQRERWLRVLRSGRKVEGPDRRRSAAPKAVPVLRTLFGISGGVCDLEIRPLQGQSRRGRAKQVMKTSRELHPRPYLENATGAAIP